MPDFYYLPIQRRPIHVPKGMRALALDSEARVCLIDPEGNVVNAFRISEIHPGDTGLSVMGNLVLSGTLRFLDTVWDDIRVAVNAVKAISGREPTWESWGVGALPAFTDEAIEVNEKAVTFTVQLPHGYKHGTDLEPHVHWIAEDDTAGDVRWQLDYQWANIGDPFPVGGSVYVNASNDVSDTDLHLISGFTDLDGTGKRGSSMLVCTLRRNSSDAGDTLTGKKAYLLEVDFHFQLDKIGSDDAIPA